MHLHWLDILKKHVGRAVAGAVGFGAFGGGLRRPRDGRLGFGPGVSDCPPVIEHWTPHAHSNRPQSPRLSGFSADPGFWQPDGERLH